MNQDLTNWACSVCGTTGQNMTMVQATIMCMECLDDIKKRATAQAKSLADTVATVVKENDIYD